MEMASQHRNRRPSVSSVDNLFESHPSYTIYSSFVFFFLIIFAFKHSNEHHRRQNAIRHVDNYLLFDHIKNSLLSIAELHFDICAKYEYTINLLPFFLAVLI